jgi:hypothetical protein
MTQSGQAARIRVPVNVADYVVTLIRHSGVIHIGVDHRREELPDVELP